MKRLTTLATVLVVAVLICSAQQPIKRRFGAPTFYGPVRTVRIERAEITNQYSQLTEGPRTLLQTVTFNEDGTRKELIVYRSDRAISGRTIETFDPDGRLLETKSFRGNGDLGNWMASVYDQSKRLIEQITYRPDGSISHRTTFVYQDNKRRYQEQTNGNPTRHLLTRPLKTGGAEIIDYDPDGGVRGRQRVKSEVDSYGNLIRQVNLVAKGDSGDFQPVVVIYRTFEYYEKN